MTCANASQHTPCPEGYLDWHAWAKKKAKTHEQTQCAACGLWAVWVRREEGKR